MGFNKPLTFKQPTERSCVALDRQIDWLFIRSIYCEKVVPFSCLVVSNADELLGRAEGHRARTTRWPKIALIMQALAHKAAGV